MQNGTLKNSDKGEDVTDLPTPTAPTPEMIQSRREAQEESAQAAIDWKRYRADEAYRAEIDEQQLRHVEAERESYQRERPPAGARTMNYGYARVSTDEQTPALQLAALKKSGCKTVFKDDALSGATTERPALRRCLKKLGPGDTLIVWKLDRLGRSLRDLITMLQMAYDLAQARLHEGQIKVKPVSL